MARKGKKRFSRKAIKTGIFKSKLEQTVWKQLPHKRKDVKLKYEAERLDYVMKKTYIPDFIVELPDGNKFYIEVKGYLRPEDRTKMVAAKAFNPDLDIRMLFAQDNILYKGAKSRYSDWAKKNGFQYAIGTVPKEWFKT